MISYIKSKSLQWNQYKQQLKSSRQKIYFVVETLETIFFALFFALIITRFVIQVSVVPTGSMIPTMLGGVPGQPNERLIVNKFIYRFWVPQMGDIVVFESPHDDGKDYVKRCVAGPGDQVLIENGFVYINGKELILANVDVLRDNSYFGPVVVPKDHFFMLGDHRGASQDSRYWGFVPREDLVGRALFTIWPLGRMRWLR